MVFVSNQSDIFCGLGLESDSIYQWLDPDLDSTEVASTTEGILFKDASRYIVDNGDQTLFNVSLWSKHEVNVECVLKKNI